MVVRLVEYLLALMLIAISVPAVADDQAALVGGNNTFAVALYSQLKNQPGNLFFSPESISTVLAMTYAGARGETAKEMADVLHFTLPSAQLHAAMGELLKERNAAHDGYKLKEADALWGQQGYAFLPDFLTLTKSYYGAGFDRVDFKQNAEGARQTINQWIAQQTAGKIQNMITPGVLDKSTRLVLTNAIYFKGDWETQFKKEDTKEEDFHVSAAQTVKAPMMHRAGAFNYSDGGTFQALEIPYKNKELSMIIFLPKAADGLSAFEQSLTPEAMGQWLGRLQPVSKVIVAMPKFKMENQFSLADTLGAMGMKLAFDGKSADFSSMASKETMLHDGNLYISAVIHKAYVDVSEEGTEAAAATAVVMASAMCSSCGPPPPPIFRADHPFLFIIRDNKSGSILFMGRVTQPEGETMPTISQRQPELSPYAPPSSPTQPQSRIFHFYHVTVDTSAMTGAAAKIDFQLNPGGVACKRTTAVILDFSMDGGHAQEKRESNGMAYGMLPHSLMLENHKMLNDTLQSVILGRSFSFNLLLGGESLEHPGGDAGTAFAMSVYDKTGKYPLLSTNPSGSVFALAIGTNGIVKTDVLSPAVVFKELE